MHDQQELALALAALDRMSLGQLRVKYQEVFGEPTRSGNRRFLAKRIAWRIQSLAEGGLSERARRLGHPLPPGPQSGRQTLKTAVRTKGRVAL